MDASLPKWCLAKNLVPYQDGRPLCPFGIGVKFLIFLKMWRHIKLAEKKLKKVNFPKNSNDAFYDSLGKI